MSFAGTSQNAERHAESWMRRALQLAAAEFPHPNPRVGAVVVSPEGRVVSAAAHRRAGEPHAEVLALDAAGSDAAGGTLVVTMEPCVHAGRTGPCTEAVVAAGVTRIVVGVRDPDSRVDGRGLERLRAAGLDVSSGLLEDEIRAADPAYFHHRATGRPLITAKWAMTLDGQVAAADGTSQWITDEPARLDAHRLRAEHDAVMVGAGTVVADDPRLTVRIPGYTGPQPRPVIVAGERPLPVAAHLYEREPLVFAPYPGVYPGAIDLPGPAGVDLGSMVQRLGEMEILSVLVEGGPILTTAMWEAGLIDQGVAYVGGRIGGGPGRTPFDGTFPSIDAARPVEITEVAAVGPDVRIRFVRSA